MIIILLAGRKPLGLAEKACAIVTRRAGYFAIESYGASASSTFLEKQRTSQIHEDTRYTYLEEVH